VEDSDSEESQQVEDKCDEVLGLPPGDDVNILPLRAQCVFEGIDEESSDSKADLSIDGLSDD
jgi:hypothetical protein